MTIDSLRADKCFGSLKLAKIPNIDTLIKNGLYFTQTISSADQTGTSLASVFTALFPITTGLTHFNFPPDTKTYLDTFKKNGYFTCGYFPDHNFFVNLSSKLDDVNTYIYDKLESWKNLSGGTGNSIIEKLKLLKNHEPWIFVVHIMDLHNLYALSDEFKKEEYGESDYDRMLSSIDVWIGKFLKEIDFEKTLVIISSDHGSYIPITGKIPDEIPSIQNIMKKGKSIVPFLEPIGIASFLLLRKFARKLRMQKLKKQYSQYELRSLSNRGNIELYEETIRVPLIFAGHGINSPKIINNLVRHVDIFPTISELIGFENSEQNVDGRSLVPLIKNEKLIEIPAYIETGVTASQFSEKINPTSTGQIIGLRTSRYKYYRSRNNSEELATLFDLKNDPNELKNIAKENPIIVNELENKLKNLINSSHVERPEDLTVEEQEKAEKLLKKLGYI